MKLLIACDMEGISGVVDWEHVQPGSREYERFRRIMTADVNAVVRGAFDGGADDIIVSDGHENGRNILFEELDSRATLNSGSLSPLAIVQGVDTGVEAALFVGFHARYGAPEALLSHTWSGITRNLWLEDVLVGETGLCAAVCGHFGVPVIFISGDDKVCAEATELLGLIETAVVKHAHGRQSAECLPLKAAQGLLYESAVRAVMRLKAGELPTVRRGSGPVKMVIELMEPAMMPLVTKVAGVKKVDATRVKVAAKDILDAFRIFRECNLIEVE